MTISDLRANWKPSILAIAANRGASQVRVFGSVARNESDEQSDIDFLVDLEPGRTLFDLSGLSIELELLLKVNVDVVTSNGLKPNIRERVLTEAILL